MAMQVCVCCDSWYKETLQNPCVCPDCDEELKAKKKAEKQEADDAFVNYLIDREIRSSNR
jgi:hypothetical protein